MSDVPIGDGSGSYLPNMRVGANHSPVDERERRRDHCRYRSCDAFGLRKAVTPCFAPANGKRPNQWRVTMDNSTPVFWIWIAAVFLFAAAITVAYHFVRKMWKRVAKRDVSP